LDSSDRPHISYHEYGILQYSYRDNSGWHIESVDQQGNVEQYTSIAIDAFDRPHISYYDDTGEDLKYAFFNGTEWQLEIVETEGDIGTYTSLVLDSHGNPHISYYDDTNGDLKYASRNIFGWSSEVVDSDGDVGRYTSIAIDSAGLPQISYCSYTDYLYSLRLAVRDGSGWNVTIVDGSGDAGSFNSIALDSKGHPHISYYDALNHEPKYAYWGELPVAEYPLLPTQLNLVQVWPNPTNSEIRARIKLSTGRAIVRPSLFNIYGRRIADLPGIEVFGSSSTATDITLRLPHAIPSGQYFLTLDGSDRQLSAPIIILK